VNETALREIAQQSKDFNDFSYRVWIATQPYRVYTANDIGKPVRLQATTFGRVRPTEYNGDFPSYGTITKINKVSITVMTRKGKYLYPIDTLVSDDISYILSKTNDEWLEFFQQCRGA
jgi:hypothetical protein